MRPQGLKARDSALNEFRTGFICTGEPLGCCCKGSCQLQFSADTVDAHGSVPANKPKSCAALGRRLQACQRSNDISQEDNEA